MLRWHATAAGPSYRPAHTVSIDRGHRAYICDWCDGFVNGVWLHNVPKAAWQLSLVSLSQVLLHVVLDTGSST